MTEPARLALITPVVAEPDGFAPALAVACEAAPVAAVLLRLEFADERKLVNRVKALAPLAQQHGAAVIVWVMDGPGPSAVDPVTVAVRGGADGVHAPSLDSLRTLRERVAGERSVGVGALRSKHDAMLAGETGADYLLFGEPRADGSLPPLDLVVERAEWWAEIFETPCLVYAPALDAVARLGGTGAEFVTLGDAVWTHPEGPAAALRVAVAALNPGGRA